MNPLLGVFFHWLGGLASGSFYVPFRGVKTWSWETAWLVAGIFSWLVAPWFFALLHTTDVITVLREAPGDVWFYAYLFGALWGFGGLTFGLAIRYLGMSLGMAVALGYCTVFGTLIPPIFRGEFASKLIEPEGGRWVLLGLLVCVIGIVVTALAGNAKEKEMSAEQKQETIKEFDFKKGILVATFSGIMSACFAFGLSAGDKIREITYKVDLTHSANDLLSGSDSVTRTEEPPADQVESLLASLRQVDALAASRDRSLKACLSILEKPALLQAAPSTEPTTLDQAATKAERIRQTLATLDQPLAGRLLDYATHLETSQHAALLGGLSSLSERETAVQIEQAGLDLAALHRKHQLWTGLPVLIVVLLGGFTTNFIWCLILNIRNRTGYEYFAKHTRNPTPASRAAPAENPTDAPAVELAAAAPAEQITQGLPVPRLRNYFFAALAGVTWYFQFFFYSMGETQMGDYKFSSWTLHMASIIIFSSFWGLALSEWKGASRRSKLLLFGGLAILVLSTIVIGYGNKVGGGGGGH